MTTTNPTGDLTVTFATATDVGGREANADYAYVEHNELGTGAALVDGIGSSHEVVAAARRAAETAAVTASHRQAQAGIMAAADTMPNYLAAPNAVAAVVSIEPDGRIEIAHVGDAAVWTWSRSAGLRRWTVDQTAGEHVAHMLRNPNLTTPAHDALQRHGAAVTNALADYVLTGLKYATTSTVSWTPLRGDLANVDLVLLTSDGVHKALPGHEIAALAARHTADAQALADALVANALAAPLDDPGEAADNTTAVVITLTRGAGQS